MSRWCTTSSSSRVMAVGFIATVLLATTTVVGGYVLRLCGDSEEWKAYDPATVEAMKETLIQDLMATTPTDDPDELYYCTVDTWRGIIMWGYAECSAVDSCPACLKTAGESLYEQDCPNGEGTALDDLCTVKVGFLMADVCVRVSD